MDKLKVIMNQPTFKIKCHECKTELHSKKSNQWKRCVCGKVAIDGGINKRERRLIGELDLVDICE